MSDRVNLYLEAHVTIEPVFDERRDQAKAIAKQYGFRLADLLMKKSRAETEQRSDKDTFMTGRSQSKTEMSQRVCSLVQELQCNGFDVWRYKIEDTLLDSHFNDELNLLGNKE